MAILTLEQATKLNTICWGNKDTALGTRARDLETYGLVILTKIITTGSTSIQTLTVPFDIEIVDVVVQARGASTSGTMKLEDGTTDITDTITCAVDKVIDRAGTIDDSVSQISAGGTLGVICAGSSVASTIGLVSIICKRT